MVYLEVPFGRVKNNSKCPLDLEPKCTPCSEIRRQERCLFLVFTLPMVCMWVCGYYLAMPLRDTARNLHLQTSLSFIKYKIIMNGALSKVHGIIIIEPNNHTRNLTLTQNISIKILHLYGVFLSTLVE